MVDTGPQFTSAVFYNLLEEYKVQSLWYNTAYQQITILLFLLIV